LVQSILDEEGTEAVHVIFFMQRVQKFNIALADLDRIIHVDGLMLGFCSI